MAQLEHLVERLNKACRGKDEAPSSYPWTINALLEERNYCCEKVDKYGDKVKTCCIPCYDILNGILKSKLRCICQGCATDCYSLFADWSHGRITYYTAERINEMLASSGNLCRKCWNSSCNDNGYKNVDIEEIKELLRSDNFDVEDVCRMLDKLKVV